MPAATHSLCCGLHSCAASRLGNGELSAFGRRLCLQNETGWMFDWDGFFQAKDSRFFLGASRFVGMTSGWGWDGTMRIR